MYNYNHAAAEKKTIGLKVNKAETKPTKVNLFSVIINIF